MGAVTGVWRWRHNPLCRATDLAEAWVALVAVLLLVLAAPALGWISGSMTDESLRQQARQQTQQRRPVTATVVGLAPPAGTPVYDPDAASALDRRQPVIARWTSADGGRHSGTLSPLLKNPRAGDRFTLWTDGEGRVLSRPMDMTTVRIHAVLAGIGAAFFSALLIECARRLVRRRLVRRRYERLDRAWAAAGPDWGRAGAGS
ncbi:Rv1733c family protein [Streptomyces sp. NPDC055078]